MKIKTKKTSFVAWFNPKDTTHITAYQYYLNTKEWPKDFLPEEVEILRSYRKTVEALIIRTYLSLFEVETLAQGFNHYNKGLPISDKALTTMDNVFSLGEHLTHLCGPLHILSRIHIGDKARSVQSIIEARKEHE
jgi:hypothetical protein